MSWWSSIVETVKKDIGEFASVVKHDTVSTVNDVLAGKSVTEAGVVGKLLAKEETAETSPSTDALQIDQNVGGASALPPSAAAVVARLQTLNDEEELTWDADEEETADIASKEAGSDGDAASANDLPDGVESGNDDTPAVDAADSVLTDGNELDGSAVPPEEEPSPAESESSTGDTGPASTQDDTVTVENVAEVSDAADASG